MRAAQAIFLYHTVKYVMFTWPFHFHFQLSTPLTLLAISLWTELTSLFSRQPKFTFSVLQTLLRDAFVPPQEFIFSAGWSSGCDL